MPVGPINYNSEYLAFGVLNGRLPNDQEGPRALPLRLDFSTATAYLLDLKLAQQQARLSFVQTIYIDNSLNASPFSLNSQQVGQIITIPAGCQGFVPVLSLTSPVLIASSNGGVVVPIFLMNFPVSPAVWSSNAPVLSIDPVTGRLLVSDVALDALIGNWNANGNALAVADLGLQSGLTHYSFLAANVAFVDSVKAAPGFVGSIQCFNIGAAPVYLKFYDTAAVPVAGAGTPDWRCTIPGNTAGAGFVTEIPNGGLKFVTGIGIALVAGIADASAVAVPAAEIYVNIGWK